MITGMQIGANRGVNSSFKMSPFLVTARTETLHAFAVALNEKGENQRNIPCAVWSTMRKKHKNLIKRSMKKEFSDLLFHLKKMQSDL